MNPFPADTAPALAAVLAPVRRQRAAWVLAVGLPWLPAAAAAAWRLAGPGIGLGVAATAAAILAARIAWALRALDAAWLVRRLDAHDPRFEDSSALLLEPADRLHPLLRLQRERVRVRLARGTHPDLRRAWPARRLLAGGTGAALVVAAALAWPPAALPGLAPASRAAVRTRSPVPVTLRDAHLHVTPPAYTAMPDRDVDGLDARVPEASRLRWRLRFDPQPAGVALHFHDGRRLALRRDGADWVADATLRKPALYRIVAAHAGAAAVQPDRPHRIDVDADRAPRLRVTRPGQTLTASGDGLRHWQLAFEGIDDHGVSPRAALRIITARGSGEAVTFDAVDRTLTGTGPARRRAFRHTVDVAALGLGAGDELIVRFSVADNRPGRAQRVDSPSYILRWPSQEASTVSAIDGMVKTVLPAYFRSQRQIIIDAEALLKQKPRLETDTFAARSDAIGVDQRLLRLRYGQFLGEETEGAPRRPLMPTNDAEDEAAAGAPPAVADAPHAGAGVATVAAADAPQAGPGIAAVPVEAAAATLAHAGGAHVDASSDTPMARSGADVPGSDGDGDAHDGHAHGGVEDAHAAAPAFGAASDVLAEFGHTHDHAEAATLLDPATRRTLKSALDAMWESERMLRQGMPQAALAPANLALKLIKQVQQADRIYLARVGYEQVPVDAGRRMGGERTGIVPRPRDALLARTTPDAAPAALWRALQGKRAVGSELAAFEDWLARGGRGVRDPLTLAAAAEALRRQPGCAGCRERLRAQLWPLLMPPLPAPAPRDAGDAAGRAYLDALAEPAR